MTENSLSTRFHNGAGFEQLYEGALAGLQAELFDSGTTQEILDRWSSLLTEQAADLVSPETVKEEAAGIAGYFDATDPADEADPDAAATPAAQG